jgi:hypothetical protein
MGSSQDQDQGSEGSSEDTGGGGTLYWTLFS